MAGLSDPLWTYKRTKTIMHALHPIAHRAAKD